MAEIPLDPLQQAWSLCYLDPARSAALAREVAASGGSDAGWGFWLLALAEARGGRAEQAAAALAEARADFAGLRDADELAHALSLCDELDAMLLRQAGDVAAAVRRHEAAERQGGDADAACTPLQRFIVHNSRAMSYRALGRVDDALRHLLAARDAAEDSANAGARITVLCNLGGLQQDLFNLDDAREASELAFRLARELPAPRQLAVAANNLIVLRYALDDSAAAHATARFMLEHQQELPAGAVGQYRSAIALGHLAGGDAQAAQELLDRGNAPVPGDGDGLLFWTWVGMRCALARGDAARACALAEQTLEQRAASGAPDLPFDQMELQLALAEACERLGELPTALACMRRAHRLYAELAGRSARARRIALEVGHELARARQERDQAIETQRRVDDDRRRLAVLNEALRAQVAETERLHGQLREQALHDPLTGLHNRRYLFESAPALLELTRRQGTQLCVVLLDLDHFKHLNDTHGHQAGDKVLQAFAARGRSMLRRSDLLCRYGGEEFVAVMPDIDAEGAYVVLGRLLEACLAEPLVASDRALPLSTFSAGIALFPQHGGSLDALLQRADLALYAAKGQGRARIEIAALSGHGALN